MEHHTDNRQYIPGWAVDADETNEPTHPIKKYTGDDHMRSHWQRPFLQQQTVEILRSNERPTLSSVYGTSCPPAGISGLIRRWAFKYSENKFRHWIPLLMADRMNVMEGVLGDIVHLRFPRYWRERGWKALWRHSPWALVRRIFIRLVLVGGLVALVMYGDWA